MILIDEVRNKIEVAEAAVHAHYELQILQLEQRCKSMQRLAAQYMDERANIASHLSEMGLLLSPSGTISRKAQNDQA